MAKEIHERKLTDAGISNFNIGFESTGTALVGFNFEAQLEAHDGGYGGPSVLIQSAIAADPSLSLQAIEEMALKRAVEILGRFAAIPPDEFSAMIKSSRKPSE